MFFSGHIQVEKRPNSGGTAIVNTVVAGSQAEAAGMKRGDILCFAGSNGQEEMMYEMFLDLAKSEQRPIREFLDFIYLHLMCRVCVFADSVYSFLFSFFFLG